jgi:hypothetical protein
MGRRDISDPSSWRDLSQTADPSLDEMGEREYAEASDRAELVLERALDPELVRRRGVEMRSAAVVRERGRSERHSTFLTSPAQHRRAWAEAEGGGGLKPRRLTDRQRQAKRRAAAEREAAEDAVAARAQELEREFGQLSVPTRERRLAARRKLGQQSVGRKRFRAALDGVNGTRLLGYYDGTPWVLIRDEAERREYWYQPATRDASWEEPRELQDQPPTDAAERRRTAIDGASRRSGRRLRRHRRLQQLYLCCVARLAHSYPDYVSQQLCAAQDAATAGLLGLGVALAWLKHAGVANLYVTMGMQTVREKHGENWKHHLRGTSPPSDTLTA